jgi:hypothetical protein
MTIATAKSADAATESTEPKTTKPRATKSKAADAAPVAAEPETVEPKTTPITAPKPQPVMSLAERMKADDELNKSKPSAPFAQFINAQGRVFISSEQGEKAGVDFGLLMSAGWVPTLIQLGTDDVAGYSTNHLRFVMCHRYSIFDTERSKYDKFLQIFLFTPDNALINTAPIQLKMRGGSVASGTFYSAVEDSKEDSWIAALFKAFNELFGNRGGSGEFQSGVIVDIKTRCEVKGTGKDKSKAAVFYDCVLPTAAAIDNGSMFIHYNEDPHADPDADDTTLKRRILDARSVFQTRIEERKGYAAQEKQAKADHDGDGDGDIPDGAEY